MDNVSRPDRSAMLKRIQAADFALYETALFLDGHPNNRKALEYYKATRDLLKELREEYARDYGPLTMYDNNSDSSWQWVDKPWPWEKEGN